MKIKDFSATKLFSKQIETIFGKEATFGDITKVKKNSNGNLLCVHVESFVKDLNRAKVIKAKIVMIPTNEANGIEKNNLIKVQEDQFIE